MNLLTKTRPLWQLMIVLACFVVPVSAGITYFVGGIGPMIASLIACAVILPLIALTVKPHFARER
jgi:hypothetical protein